MTERKRASLKPLQAMGFGFVFLLLNVPVATISEDGPGFDLYPDPVAWLLILVGLSRLPTQTPHLRLLWTFGPLALLISSVLWFPKMLQGMAEADPSLALAWGSELPRWAFIAILCWSLMQVATGEGELAAAGWFRTAMTLSAAAGVLPILVLGADLDWLGEVAGAAALLSIFAMIALTFGYAGREWAGAPPVAPAPSPSP